METKIYVPAIIQEENKLFEVNVLENSHGENSLLIEGKKEPRYERLFKKKIPEINCEIGLMPTDGETVFNDFSNSTYSITLGTLIAAKVFTYKMKFKNEYKGIVITGNLAEDNEYLCVVDDIKEKYEAAKSIVENQTDKVLFLYVSDEEEDLGKDNNIKVVRFTSYDRLEDLISYLFVTYHLEINYDPETYEYEFIDENFIGKLVFKQLEYPETSIDMESFSVKIHIDENRFPKSIKHPEFTICYKMIHRMERSIKLAVKLLFSSQMKKRYSSIDLNYGESLRNIIDSLLSRCPVINGKDGYTEIDAVLKNKSWSLIIPIQVDMWNFVVCKYFGPEVLFKPVQRESKFELLEIELTANSKFDVKKWRTECFIPSLIERYYSGVENENIKEDEIDFEKIFDTSQWWVMGLH